VGGRYQIGEGEIEVDSIEQIAIQDITHPLAIESGFLGVIDLLKVAKHGPRDNVYWVRFHYIRPRAGRPAPRKSVSCAVEIPTKHTGPVGRGGGRNGLYCGED
jgi:hypothetical protein